MRSALSVILVCLGLTPVAAHADPPAETLEHLDQALHFLAREGPARSATVGIRTSISKPDGSDAEEQVRTMSVTINDDGEIDSTVIQVLQDGVDVTDDEEAQSSFGKPSDEEAESIESAEDDGDDGGSFSIAMSLPAGDDLADYRFGETRTSGAAHVADFEPVSGKSRKERTKLSRGRLAWDPTTLDPLWVEFVPSRNPRFVTSMACRMDFTRTDPWLYPDRTTVDGTGGVLLYKRRMVFEMTLGDVR